MASLDEIIALIECTTASKYTKYPNLNSEELRSIAEYIVKINYKLPSFKMLMMNWSKVVAEVDEMISNYFSLFRKYDNSVIGNS